MSDLQTTDSKKVREFRCETNGEAHILLTDDDVWKNFTVKSPASSVIAHMAIASAVHGNQTWCSYSDVNGPHSKLEEFSIKWVK